MSYTFFNEYYLFHKNPPVVTEATEVAEVTVLTVMTLVTEVTIVIIKVKNNFFLNVMTKKLDGVGPTDNKPSTD